MLYFPVNSFQSCKGDFLSSWVEPVLSLWQATGMYGKWLCYKGLELKCLIIKIANSEDPDQTASSEAVWSGYVLFLLAFKQF